MSKITVELDWNAEAMLMESALRNGNSLAGELKRLVTLALTGRLPVVAKEETVKFPRKGKGKRKPSQLERRRGLRVFRPGRDPNAPRIYRGRSQES